MLDPHRVSRRTLRNGYSGKGVQSVQPIRNLDMSDSRSRAAGPQKTLEEITVPALSRTLSSRRLESSLSNPIHRRSCRSTLILVDRAGSQSLFQPLGNRLRNTEAAWRLFPAGPTLQAWQYSIHRVVTDLFVR